MVAEVVVVHLEARLGLRLEETMVAGEVEELVVAAVVEEEAGQVVGIGAEVQVVVGWGVEVLVGI